MSGQISTASATKSPGAIAHPPTDLYSDEPPLESHLHLQQMMLLISCLNWLWRDRQDYFATGNLTIFYNQDQLKTKDYPGPDFFVALNTDPQPRKSWTIWQEGGKYPNVIIELLSPSTAHIDRGKTVETIFDLMVWRFSESLVRTRF
ncbi:Uma2 family endonuclease [bacterium]|nr:Uma2 family endonuclease [bacterium]